MPKFSHFFFHSHSLFSRNFKFLFLAKLFHATASILTFFFFPVFLFNLGKDTPLLSFAPVGDFQKGMIAVGTYFLFQRFVILLINQPIGKFIGRIGYRNGMILGQVMNIIFLSIMQFVSDNPWFIILALAIESFKVPLFWTSYHSLFANTAIYKNMGKSVGTVEFFTRLLHVALPAISGFIIVTFGFSTLFLVSLSLQFVSMMILFLVEQPPSVSITSFLEQFTIFKPYKSKSLLFGLAGRYVVESLQFLWPFFVVLLIGSVEEVGFLYSVVFFLSLLMIYFSGWYVDHQKGRRPLLLSGALMGALWLGRATVTTPWGVIALDTVDKLLASIFYPFYDSLLYKGAKGKFTLAYFVYRERVLSATGVLFWLIFVLYFSFFENWQPLMMIGFIAMPLALQLRDISQKKG